MLRRPILLVFLTFLPTSFAAVCYAQPLGNEPQTIHRLVNDDRERIAAVGRRITNDSLNPVLYAERASLYVQLYRDLYEGAYRRYYGEKSVDLGVAAIATHAIADLSKALKQRQSSELYYRRGEMHEVRWIEAAKAMRQSVWEERTRYYGDSQRWFNRQWEVLTKKTEKRELAGFRRFQANPDFASAVRDYTNALRLDTKRELSNEIHAKLARLYLGRAGQVPIELPPIKRIITDSHGYSIWDDIDTALNHLAQTDSICLQNLFLEESFYRLQWITRARLYYYKAMLARTLGKNDIAIEALDSAAEYLDENRLNELYSFFCDVYTERSTQNLVLRNFEAALNDANSVLPSVKGGFCSRAYVPRGDANLAKGNWQGAISDYTRAIKELGNDDSLPRVYKQRAIAYMKVGEIEKALADLNFFQYSRSPLRTAEDYRMRARAYRELGKRDQAIADEQTAARITAYAELNGETDYVLGRIMKPRGFFGANEKVELSLDLIYAEGPEPTLAGSVSGDGRFILPFAKGRPFSVAVFVFVYSKNGDGQPVQYTSSRYGDAIQFVGAPRTLIVRGPQGPIIIRADRIVRDSP